MSVCHRYCPTDQRLRCSEESCRDKIQLGELCYGVNSDCRSDHKQEVQWRHMGCVTKQVVDLAIEEANKLGLALGSWLGRLHSLL